jgi:mRNA interferase MazF
VSRQVVLDSRFSTVVCAPVYTQHDGLASQLSIGIEEGMKHESSIHCDELVSLPKSALTNFVGTLSPKKLQGLNQALAIALDLL